MSTLPNQGYVKEIIKEYNERLQSWGHSDTWNLTQFKTLANMLNEATNININAATLKRFFQQHTGNPQMATKEALCIYLGYKGYTDFVMRKEAEMQKRAAAEPDSTAAAEPDDIADESPEAEETEEPAAAAAQAEAKPEIKAAPEAPKPAATGEDITPVQEYIRHHQRSRKYLAVLVFATLIVLGIIAYRYWLKDVYIDYLLSKIEFSVSPESGNSPLTVSFSYDIPQKLMKDITIGYVEANGDVTERKLPENMHSVNTTFIYEGEGFAYLKYKDEEIRRLAVNSHKPGWSVSVRDERRNFYKTYTIDEVVRPGEGYISLPFDSIPEEARTNHMFVTYTYFKENLIDGDNFIIEANVRNSAEEHAIPCSDIIMYIGSDAATHGFAMNEQGNAFIKFISSENEMKGDTHSFDLANFSATPWQVMKIVVENGQSKFYIDNKLIDEMEYEQPVGPVDQLIFRFKGCGAVDWVRLSKSDGTVVFEETFGQE